MANEALAVLQIPQSVIDSMDKYDKKLAEIEKNSKQKVGNINKALSTLGSASSPILAVLLQIRDRLEQIGTSGAKVQNVARSLQNVETSAQSSTTSVNRMNTSLTQTSQLLNRLAVSRPFQDLNITQLKDRISNINSMLNSQGKDITFNGETIGKSPVYSQQEQQNLVNRRNLLQQELQMQQTSESAKIASINRVAQEQNKDVLNQQKNDVKALQSHLQAMDKRTQAAEAQSSKLRQLGEQQVQQTIKNAQRMSQSQVQSIPAGTSVRRYQELGQQIDALTQKITRLRALQFRFKEAAATSPNAAKTAANQEATIQEYQREIGLLRQKQQWVVNVNQAYQQQKQMLASLQQQEQQRTSVPNQRSQNTLAQMRAYYTELEKASARAAAQAEREAQRKAAAEERAAAQARKAWEKETPKYANQYHDQRQSQLNSTFSKQNTTASMALAESKAAKTLREEAQAVELLKQARLNLSRTDSDYKVKLDAINAAIAQHNRNLQQAGVQSSSLAQRHRNLMDITGQLARKFALLFSVSQVQGYIGQIAKVRGEFELQQRSLEAILQNKTEADAIFQKTVDLAIKSPFQIKELVSYTKQLAAYRIEGDKLYDTTKRLADVSAGLGVDMQRLILAYGQVKAAAYLRGTEVRQFTEAGVNMYGELQSYFQEVKGEAYTTAQIVDMISKRMVKFEDVEAVFQRLTDKGGLFYNMQEIQSETLNGKIANLKDSLDVMMNEIGKANEGALKGTIDGVKTLLDNWESVATAGKSLAAVLALLYAYSLRTGVSLKQVFTTNFATNATKNVTLLEMLKNGFTSAGKAANIFGANLKAAFMSNLPALAIMAVITAITDLIGRVNRYREELSRIIKDNGALESSLQSVRVAFEDAGNGEDGFKKKQAQLNRLKDMYDKAGIELKINIKDIDESKIDEEFSKLLDGYRAYLKTKKALEVSFAENNSRVEGLFNIFGDNIDTDAEQVASAYENVITKTKQVDNAVNILYDSYDKLSEQQKQSLDAANTRGKGESELDYLKRRSDAIRDITNDIIKQTSFYDELRSTANSAANENRAFMKSYYSWASKGLDSFESQVHEFDRELDDIVARMKKRFTAEEWAKNKTLYLKAAIETNAAEKGWNEWLTKHAEEHVGIKVDIDEEHQKQQIDWAKKNLKDSLDGTKINVDIELDTNFLDSVFNQVDAAQKYLKNVGKYKDFSKGGRTRKVTWGEVKGDSDFTNWYQNTYRKNNASVKAGRIADGMEISDFTIQQYVDAQEKKARAIITGSNQEIEADKKTSKSRANAAAKAERDIWNERISVLKEMQQQYEKVRKNYGEDTARSMVKSEYSDDLAYVNMGQVINPEEIVPTKQGLIDALEKTIKALPTTLKDYRKKVSSLNKDISELKLQIDTEEANRKLEETKKYVDNLFTGLDLHQKLKDIGLSESEVQAMFPGLAKTLDDVERGINDRYKSEHPDGSYLDTQTEQGKAYQSEIKKLNEQRIKEQENLVIELTKAYKTQLSDQLQLDKWYYEEKAKIDKANLTPEQKTEYNKNLDTQYQKKSDENTWKEFQNSDFYINLFENLDQTSSRVIDAMRKKLNSLRDNLKDLPADQLKAIINQIEKLDELSAQKNPFKTVTKSLKTYITFLGKRKQLENEYLAANQKIDKLEDEKKSHSDIIAKLEAEKNAEEEQNGVGTERATQLQDQINKEKELLDTVLKRLVAEGKISEEKAKQIRDGQKSEKSVTDSLHEIGSYFTGAADIITGGVEALNDWGLNIELSDEMVEITDGISKIGNSLNSIDLTKPMSIITGTIGVVGGIGKTLGGIFGWGTKDKKLQRQIEKQQEKIEELSKAYDKLKEHMDAAWDISKLESYYDQTVDNLEAQITSYKAMIRAEEDKKDTDNDKIKEWKQSIEDIEDQIVELKESYTESLGGFGSEENYQSAAQAFADAWADAYSEGEDALDALNDKWDEYITNLIKKQAMLRVVGAAIEPLLKKVDEYVSEQSAGGIKLTRDELATLQTQADALLPYLNESLGDLMNTLDYTGTSADDNLDALTQSIEGVSEDTAEAIKALLNSIRFLLAMQQGDVAIIRSILEQQYGLATSIANTLAATQEIDDDTTNASTPMLTELKLQTQYLKALSSNVSNMMAYSQSSRGAGLRVYVQ